jgi:hypothetical protein
LLTFYSLHCNKAYTKFEQGMGTPTICFFGYAFVNGTDMIQMLDFNNTSEELWEELQKVEAAISSTCEAIISEERHLCLVDFPWQGVK